MIVWRSTYTNAVARAVSAEAHAEALREHVAYLREQLAGMQAERIEAAKPKTLPAKKTDPVMDAIAQVSGPDAARRKRLGALVRAWRKEDLTDEVIISRLTNWKSTDEDEE
jgi:hypothetical protein